MKVSKHEKLECFDVEVSEARYSFERVFREDGLYVYATHAFSQIAWLENHIAALEQRLATQKKATDALHEFAQSVAGGSSWWDDVWPDIEKELEAGGEG